MTYGGRQIFKVTSTGIAGLKVAICSKLRRLTRNGGAGACCRVASVASLLGWLQLATMSARLRQAKFFSLFRTKFKCPHEKSRKCKSYLAGAPFAGRSFRQSF